MYTSSFIRVWILAGLIAIPLLALHALAPTAAAQPELSESDPEDGAVLGVPPETIRICFSEPVKSEGSKDFDVVVVAPDNQRLGTRILFDSEGNCADIFPGHPEGEIEGIWEVQWEVTSRETSETGSGSFQFTVSPTPTPTPSPTGTAAAPSGLGEDNGGIDTLVPALIIAVLGLLVYSRLLRRRTRFRR